MNTHQLRFDENHHFNQINGVSYVTRVQAEIEIVALSVDYLPIRLQHASRENPSISVTYGANRKMEINLTLALTEEETNEYLALRSRVMARAMAALGIEESK